MARLQPDERGAVDRLLEATRRAQAAAVPPSAAGSPPDAGRGSRRRSQWLAPPADGQGSVAPGDSGAARSDGPQRRGDAWSAAVLVALLVLLVAMVLAIASAASHR